MVRAFAPATIANLGPGFDMYGVALNGLGDIVEAETKESFWKGASLDRIWPETAGLPWGPENVVQAVSQFLLEKEEEGKGLSLSLYKNMGIGTGLGSSSSSGVAAAWATNALLDRPMEKSDRAMLEAVVHGEAVAIKKETGHPDNVWPSLLGGFVFIYDFANFYYERHEVHDSINFVVVSPDLRVDTGMAREALKAAPYDIGMLVAYSAAFVKGARFLGSEREFQAYCSNLEFANSQVVMEGGQENTVKNYFLGAKKVYDGIVKGDPVLLGEGVMMDGIVTPVRARFIRGYEKVGESFMNAGAFGYSISGSGPSMFAVVSRENAEAVANAGVSAFLSMGINSSALVSKVNNLGAYLMD
ncbi:hypothetical protein HYU11_04485 [Candidatus Woesearchaeota archaeon]|nr:hypothetical protein [Candidatus Woesearchaeota archaeon]